MLGEGGDVEAAFTAGKTVEAMYTYHYVSHADLEPQNCTAWFKGDSIEIWAPTQTPQAAVDAVAALLGLPKEKVTLHQLRGGGGFGRRLANDSVCEVAAVSKQAGGIPVKVQWTREDDMAFDYYRPGGFHSLKAAVDKSPASSPRGRTTSSRSRVDGKAPRQRGQPRRDRVPGASGREQPHAAVDDPVENSDGSVARAGHRTPSRSAVQSFLHECAVAANRDYRRLPVEVMGEPRCSIADNPALVAHGPRRRT